MKKSNLKLVAYVLLAFWVGYEINDSRVASIGRFIEQNFFKKPDIVTARQSNARVFVDVSNRREVACPSARKAIVIIGFGQSNSANQAGHRFEQSGSNVVNFFDGKCYIAIDPMLGAAGSGGGVWIPFAEALTDKTVVLITFGVGSTRVSQWLDSNDLLPFYEENVRKIKSAYPNPDMAVWIQGESDVTTKPRLFEQQLTHWIERVKSDFQKTRLYLTGTSYCQGRSSANIVNSQKLVSRKFGATFIGVTDTIKEVKHRYDDCHFSERGIEKLVSLLVKGISKPVGRRPAVN